MKLRTRLILAFLVIGLSAVLAVGTLCWYSTHRLFDDYASRTRTARLSQWGDVLTGYYAQTGSWEGVTELLATSGAAGHRGQMGTGMGYGNMGGLGRPLDTLVLTDPEGAVVAGALPTGQVLTTEQLSSSLPLALNGTAIGHLLSLNSASAIADLDAGFLQHLRLTTGAAMLVVAALAIAAGSLVARHIAAPVAELTRAVASGAVETPTGGTVAEVKQLSVAYTAMRARLTANERSRRAMISDIAHELKTPLTALSANLENLADGADAPTAARAATLMDEVMRLNRLVSDLQLLSLADDGALRLCRQPTDLSLLLYRVVDLTAPVAKDQGVSLSLVPGEAVTASVDPDRITQATLNLITNALQHVPAGGSIEVSLSSQASGDRDEAVITVADTGSGIPAEALPHVFDRFYRADQSRHRPGGGSGLGLAIVHSLAQAHGGRAWAESEPGRGARFHIAVPLDAKGTASDNL